MNTMCMRIKNTGKRFTVLLLLAALLVTLLPPGARSAPYVHGESGGLSDWVDVSDAPDDAEIVNRRWEYTETTFTLSKDASMDGWILYDQSDIGGYWSDWSFWIQNPPLDIPNRDIETQSVVTGYDMFVYQTQEANAPYNRAFRDYSINGNYAGHNARVSYGEFFYTCTVSKDEFDNARRVGPGGYDGAGQQGYNRGGGTAYVMQGRAYFLRGEIRSTQYRYRDYISETTYFFKKTERKISYTAVSPSDRISDISQKVQYRLSVTPVPVPVVTYTVIFKDWNNAVLKTQSVAAGGAAAAPADPSRSGYTFTGWSGSYTDVTSDVTITALYVMQEVAPFSLFVMGEDNYRFSNSRGSFGYGSGYAIPLERYRSLYSASTASYYHTNFGLWGGSCFGFSASADLMNDFEITASRYQNGARYAYDFATPGNVNAAVTKLIETFQAAWFLPDIYNTAKRNMNNYSGLIAELTGAAGSGTVLTVHSPNAYHSILAYDIRQLGGGAYDISIYDCNYPNDGNRRMRVNENSRTFSYSGNDNWGARSADYFEYIPSKTIDKAVDAALALYAGGGIPLSVPSDDMRIIAPRGAVIERGGRPIADIDGAFEIRYPEGELARETVMWHVPNGVYDVRTGGGAEQEIVFLDDNAALALKTDARDMLVRGGMEDGGSLDVIGGAGGVFELTYMTNETADAPTVLAGETGAPFSVTAENGNVRVFGDIEVRVISGGENADISGTDAALGDTSRAAKTISLQIGSPYMTVDGVSKEIDPGRGTAAVIDDKSGRTLLPIRAVAEELGAAVYWDETARKVTIRRGDTLIEVRINSTAASVDGAGLSLDAAPVIVNGRTMLPLRFIAETLGCEVNWDAGTRTVLIVGQPY